jgi:hypothetical protein
VGISNEPIIFAGATRWETLAGRGVLTSLGCRCTLGSGLPPLVRSDLLKRLVLVAVLFTVLFLYWRLPGAEFRLPFEAQSGSSSHHLNSGAAANHYFSNPYMHFLARPGSTGRELSFDTRNTGTDSPSKVGSGVNTKVVNDCIAASSDTADNQIEHFIYSFVLAAFQVFRTNPCASSTPATPNTRVRLRNFLRVGSMKMLGYAIASSLASFNGNLPGILTK